MNNYDSIITFWRCANCQGPIYHDKAIMYISFDPIYNNTVILCAFHQGYSVIIIKLCCARGSVLVVGQYIIYCMSL